MTASHSFSSAKDMQPVDRFVGQRLREARLAAGITQEDLASKLRCTFQQVQKYEKAKNRLSPARLYLAAEILNRDLDWFFPAKIGQANASDNFVKLAATRDGHQLAAAYLSIADKKVRERLIDLIATYVRSQRS